MNQQFSWFHNSTLLAHRTARVRAPNPTDNQPMSVCYGETALGSFGGTGVQLLTRSRAGLAKSKGKGV